MALTDPPSEQQLLFLADLRRKHETDALGPVPDGATRGLVSEAITWALNQPKRQTPIPEPQASIGVGVYISSDGSLIRIRRSRFNRLMAHRVQIVRTAGTPKVVYRLLNPGFIAILANDVRDGNAAPIDRDTASKFGVLTGICCDCGRKLTDPVSIERGIGPVCVKKYSHYVTTT